MKTSPGRAVTLALVAAALAAPVPVRTGDTVAVTGTVAVIGKGKPAQDNSGVVVWLEPAGEAADRPRVEPLHIRPRVVQRNKQFEPHLLVVTVGSVVDFPNLDPYFHNVFSLFDGKRFDLGLYEAGTSRSVSFTKPGVCYVFCNIHPEMSAVVVAVDTPYYAVSSRAGAFAISDVPAGRYTVTAWHERHKLERPQDFPRDVRVSAGASSVGVIRLTESTQLTVAHKNKYGQDYVPVKNGIYK
jgi:plastocyanin